MKTLQEIEEEYKRYPGKTGVIHSLDDFLTFMEIGMDDTEEYQKDYEKELKDAERQRKKEKFYHFFLLSNYSVELDQIYDLDREILKKCISYTKEIGKYYRKIYSIATEDNYRELTRFVDFISDYYLSQTGYYDYERDQLDLFVRGISLYDPRYENTRDEFLKFLDKRMKELETKKQDPVDESMKKKEFK